MATKSPLTRRPRAHSLPPTAPLDAQRLVEAFLAGRNQRTLRAYSQDLDDFRQYLGVGTIANAARRILANGHGEANALVLGYKANLLERGLAPSTVNRRLSAVRSLVKLARTLGLVPWALEVSGVKSAPYRDTRGPGDKAIRRILADLAKQARPKAKRDRAILRLLHDLALRREEVVSLDLADLDIQTSTIVILGKGNMEKQRLTLPPETQQALVDWVAVRGDEPGPMFPNMDRAKKGWRLTGTSVWRLVRSYGLKRPHGVRHAAITEALDLTGGDMRAVQHFSRHKDVRTLNFYDDNRADLAGEVARRVAAGG